MPKAKTSNSPFHACMHLCLLVSASCGHTICQQCQPDSTYFSSGPDFIRKRRSPKPKEMSSKRNRVLDFKLQERGRTAKHKKHPWNADSGATISCTNNLDIFETIDEIHPDKRVQVASGHIIQPSIRGSVRLHMSDHKGNPYTVLLQNVYYSPEFSCQLLSVDEMYKQHKFTTVFRGRRAHFITPDGVQIPIHRDERNRYMVQVNAVLDADAEIWHRRFMHAGNSAMRRMACIIPSLAKGGFDFSKCG